MQSSFLEKYENEIHEETYCRPSEDFYEPRVGGPFWYLPVVRSDILDRRSDFCYVFICCGHDPPPV